MSKIYKNWWRSDHGGKRAKPIDPPIGTEDAEKVCRSGGSTNNKEPKRLGSPVKFQGIHRGIRVRHFMH